MEIEPSGSKCKLAEETQGVRRMKLNALAENVVEVDNDDEFFRRFTESPTE